MAKVIYYSVYVRLLETVVMIPFPKSLKNWKDNRNYSTSREKLDNFIAYMKYKRDEHFDKFKEEVCILVPMELNDYINNVSIIAKSSKSKNKSYLLTYRPNKPILSVTINDNIFNDATHLFNLITYLNPNLGKETSDNDNRETRMFSDDEEVTDDNGNTDLILASVEGHESCVQALLDAGANTDATDNNGNTALMRASNNGHESIVRLLEAGANEVRMRDDNMSVEEGLEALKDIVMTLNEPADSDNNLDPIESFNTKFKNSGSSLKSKNNIRDFDHDGLEQFKKILFYSVYEELINEFNSDISDKKNIKPIDNSAISKKKEEHTEKLINYINEIINYINKKGQLYRKPIEFPDKIDIIEGTTIDKCSDRDNICEIKFFDDPGFVIEFNNKNIIMPLIDYLYTSNNDNTDDPTPHTP